MSKTYSDMLFSGEYNGEVSPSYGSPSPPASQAREESAISRINIGWVTTPFSITPNIDKNIVEYTSKLGSCHYNFICHPIGGTTRAFIKPSKNVVSAPIIDLPDLQLANHLWETYICGEISKWIDLDSDDEQFARFSEEELIRELNYVCYLGLRTAVITLKKRNSPKLARLINQWLWTKSVMFCFWIILPPLSEIEDVQEGDDAWSIWSDFRKLCSNFLGSKLQVVVTISSELDDEFTDPNLLERWMAEPLGAICVNSDSFTTGRGGTAILPEAHVEIMKKLWVNDSLRILVIQKNDLPNFNHSLKSEYADALRSAVRDVTYMRRKNASEKDGFLAATNINYYDVLQAPLQPLSDNLDSGVYNTFEQDPIKYRKYGEAVELALKDIGEHEEIPEFVVIYLLGAGRGPLATAILEAEKRYNDAHKGKKLKVKLYVVEKNPNAIVTLRFINQKAWKNRATIIESDMRSLPQKFEELSLEKPDIIVSELLGSFGDNELSPECLDGVTQILKPTTISIPQKYTSYAAPIMSLYMHQQIKGTSLCYWNKGLAGHGRDPPVQEKDGTYTQIFPQTLDVARMDQIYVVYLRQYCRISETQPVFTFDHPNFKNLSNERSKMVTFEIDRRADLMGFAGYFDLILYKSVMLSIEPNTATPGMISWFPAVIPLRELFRVDEGDKVHFNIERKVDEQGVWYEWFVQIEKKNGEKIESERQNPNGESYFMRK
ncbi:unnamed protein product [Caenorhabditis bovis]|uniref:Protein arginine N-methyltransferase n=1 Tax=Caenorhabditis bovis TaxID=2654633 RepID=A0A8S1EN27_9PELO|nr:unnamed protein product [Caenorhabditis bovis]